MNIMSTKAQGLCHLNDCGVSTIRICDPRKDAIMKGSDQEVVRYQDSGADLTSWTIF